MCRLTNIMLKLEDKFKHIIDTVKCKSKLETMF